MPNTNAAPQQVSLTAQVNFGLSSFVNNQILNYEEPSTTTCLFDWLSPPQVITANTNNVQFNLATLLSGINTAVVIGWKDVSDPGQQINWGLTSGGARFDMAANGFTLLRLSQGQSTLPIVYFDNPSLTVNALIQFFSLAN